MAAPEPGALVALTLGQQPQPHRLIQQLEDKLRLRRVRHAKLLPVHALARLRLAQVHQQAVGQLAHRHRRLAGPVLDHFRRRRVAQQIKRPPHQHQRRMAVEEPHLAQRVSFPARHRQPVGERQLLLAILQVRRQFGHLAMKLQRLRRPAAGGHFEPGRVTPARQPVQQLQVRQHHRFLPVAAAGVRFRQPLNEFPIAGRKEFLFVRRARRQLDDLSQLLHLLARARAQQVQLDSHAVARRLFLIGLWPANRPQERARRIEVRGFGREEPRLQLADKLLLLRGVLHLGEPVEVGVSAQLRRQRPLRPQKKERHLLQPPPALRRQQPRPPIRAWKILARERELLEVVLQQQPRPLGIRASGEAPQQLLPLSDDGLRVGQFPAQIGQSPVGLGQHGIMRIVLRRLRRGRPASISE